MKWFLVILMISQMWSGYAQRSDLWLQQNDVGNFHEGTYARDVSTASMELISLTAYWEPFEYGQRQNIKVRFYSPEDGNFFLKVEELAVKKYYWMQNKPQHIQSEWNEFSGWQVDRWLRKLQLPASSLGLVVQIGPKEGRRFLPAWIYHRENKQTATRYVAQIRLGVNIDSGDYQIYRGKDRNSTGLIQQGSILGQYGGSYFPVVIQTKDIAVEGWYLVVVNIVEKGSRDPHSYSFLFYHRQ